MYSKRFVLRCALLSAAAYGISASAQVQDEEATPDAATAPPYALFQDSTITSASNTVMATRVPVVASSGVISYWDVTLVFTESASGGLTLASPPKIVLSKNPITSAFKAGTYVGPTTVYYGDMKISVAGPGIGPGGATVWSLSATTGANVCTYPTGANWYVTSSPATNPIVAARLKAAGITSTAYSYGIVGSSQCVVDNTWQKGSLIGLAQTGNKLTIVNFTNYSTGKDQRQPVDVIPYTLSGS